MGPPKPPAPLPPPSPRLTVAEWARAQEFIARLSEISGLERLSDPRLVLKALTGGRSGALVLIAALPVLKGSDDWSALIVKIAPYLKAAREKANYDQFVAPLVSAAFRPELLGFASASDFGALCFSSVYASENGLPKTLTDFMNRGDARALHLVLQRICDFLGPAWYDPAASRLERGIADRYERRFFAQKAPISACEAQLARDAARYFGAEKQSAQYSIDGAVFPSPAAMLFDKFKGLTYRSCVIHGDLNSDNLIVSPDRDLVNLVDFEHVGEGHAFEDLASVEASIRINYPQDASFSEIFELERLIAENCPAGSDNAYTLAIADVRRTAMRLFGSIEDASNYHFAVGALGLRLMQAVDLRDFARARITASTLWATRMLVEHQVY